MNEKQQATGEPMAGVVEDGTPVIVDNVTFTVSGADLIDGHIDGNMRARGFDPEQDGYAPVAWQDDLQRFVFGNVQQSELLAAVSPATIAEYLGVPNDARFETWLAENRERIVQRMREAAFKAALTYDAHGG